MKTLVLVSVMAISTIAFAQNNDKIEKTQTIKTTVNNGRESNTTTKKITTTTSRDVQLNPADTDKVNQRLSNSDLNTRTDVTYSNSDHSYRLEKDDKGMNLVMMNGTERMPLAKMRKLSTKEGYVIRNNDETSYAHFDTAGNLIVETYDYKNDSIVVKKYSVNPE
tara:strand:+ start:5510 stop:6004 length:495 start_codon:yes stop_codon:yes gene_type:complete